MFCTANIQWLLGAVYTIRVRVYERDGRQSAILAEDNQNLGGLDPAKEHYEHEARRKTQGPCSADASCLLHGLEAEYIKSCASCLGVRLSLLHYFIAIEQLT